MKKLRIAVIDNGVNCKLLNYLLGHKVNIHIFQVKENKCVQQFLLAGKNINHGTLCIGILFEFLEKRHLIDYIDITSVSILNNDYKQNLDEFIIALDWCIKKNFDIILMSVGIKSWAYIKCILPMIRKMEKKKITVVAATSNDDKLTYPSCFISVIGVKYLNDSGYEKEEKIYLSDMPIDGIEIIACFGKSFVLEKYNQRTSQHYSISNSFIVPYIASFICPYLQKHGRITKDKIMCCLEKEKGVRYLKPIFTNHILKVEIPTIVLTYNLTPNCDAIIFLQEIISEFLSENYSCVCITDACFESEFEKNILKLSSDKTEFNSYRWLLSNNSLIVMFVESNSYILKEKRNKISYNIYEADKLYI